MSSEYIELECANQLGLMEKHNSKFYVCAQEKRAQNEMGEAKLKESEMYYKKDMADRELYRARKIREKLDVKSWIQEVAQKILDAAIDLLVEESTSKKRK